MNGQCRWGTLGACALVCAFVAGCQQYQAKPPDLAGHHAAWLERKADDERVAQYAARLREAGALQSEFDVSDGISRAEAEVIALVFNGELRVARAEAGVAAATAENAGLWEDPMLGVDMMRVLANVEHQWLSMARIGFTIPISGRLGKEKELASAEHAAAIERVRAMEWSTISALRAAWIDWSAADEQVAVTQQYLDELGSLITIVDEMQRAGEMNRLESRLFQVEQLSSEQELASLEGRRDALRIAIHKLLGLAPHAAVTLQRNVHVQAAEQSEAAAALVMARNVTLRTLLADYEAAERELDLEIRTQYPDIVIGSGHEYEDGRHRIGLGVSMPFPIFNANRQAIAQARAKRDKAMAMLETSLEAVLTDLASADVMHAAAVKRRELVERDIVPLVDAQYGDAREVARLGEVNTWLLLETLRKQLETKLQLINLMREESAAVIRREEIIGPEPTVVDADQEEVP